MIKIRNIYIFVILNQIIKMSHSQMSMPQMPRGKTTPDLFEMLNKADSGENYSISKLKMQYFLIQLWVSDIIFDVFKIKKPIKRFHILIIVWII